METKLFGPQMLVNPYPIYQQLRVAHPVFYANELGAWIVTSYDAVNSALRNPQFSSDRYPRVRKRLAERGIENLVDDRVRSMLHMDPPDHTRLRALVSKAFTPGIVQSMEAHIQSVVDQLLGSVRGLSHMDVIEHLAYPLPVIVIAEMLGVPVQDRDRFRTWSNEMSILASGNVAVLPEPVLRRAAAARQELTDYFRSIIARRGYEGAENLLSALVRAEEEGGRLTEDELYSTVVLLLVAGNETTTNLIGNGVLALLRHPDQMRRVWEDPGFVGSAVEEMLRYDGPVQLTTRLAKTDLELYGSHIKQGDFVYLFLGAANRDPAQFPEPDSFDVTRTDNKHIAFGAGPHFCLGAPLARLEAQIAIRALRNHCPNLKLSVDEVEYRNNFNLRGLKSLPVSF
jgi:cytochrome P450